MLFYQGLENIIHEMFIFKNSLKISFVIEYIDFCIIVYNSKNNQYPQKQILGYPDLNTFKE